MMAQVIYLLAAGTCVLCTLLLLRQWRKTRLRLLFWSGVCFFTLTFANILLFVDLIIVPGVSLTFYRLGVTLLAIVFMLYGLVTFRSDA
jgi:hypothetical protein